MLNNAIFLAFDENYGLHARACLNSLKANFPNYPHLLVHYAGFNPETINFLQGIPRLELLGTLSIESESRSFYTGPVGSTGTYYKYHAWSPELCRFNNILYIDIDTIILKPLDALLNRTEFFATMNYEPDPQVRVFNPTDMGNPQLQALLSDDGFVAPGGPADMCNAGVIMVPPKYRTVRNYTQLLSIAERYGSFLQYADQSAISIWCRLNGIELSPHNEFNFQSTYFGLDETRKDLGEVSIVHFSNKKPNTVAFMLWKRIDLDMRKRLAKLYVEHARGDVLSR